MCRLTVNCCVSDSLVEKLHKVCQLLYELHGETFSIESVYSTFARDVLESDNDVICTEVDSFIKRLERMIKNEIKR